MFGSSALARVIVRRATNINDFLVRVIPVNVRRWIDSRFNKDEVILADGAAFDMVRASVNLVLSGLLIIIGTTMKLPLSTTYVTFIVAMGSSLADRAGVVKVLYIVLRVCFCDWWLVYHLHL